MGRTIVIILLIGFAFWGLRKLWYVVATKSSTRAEPVFERTVRCAQCDVHVSVRLALERNGKHYCCVEHLPDSAQARH